MRLFHGTVLSLRDRELPFTVGTFRCISPHNFLVLILLGFFWLLFKTPFPGIALVELGHSGLILCVGVVQEGALVAGLAAPPDNPEGVALDLVVEGAFDPALASVLVPAPFDRIFVRQRPSTIRGFTLIEGRVVPGCCRKFGQFLLELF